MSTSTRGALSVFERVAERLDGDPVDLIPQDRPEVAGPPSTATRSEGGASWPGSAASVQPATCGSREVVALDRRIAQPLHASRPSTIACATCAMAASSFARTARVIRQQLGHHLEPEQQALKLCSSVSCSSQRDSGSVVDPGVERHGVLGGGAA
jgi:hypothetical protein